MSTPPTVPSGSNLYSQGFGTTSSNSINSAVKATRAPASTDTKGASGFYPIGQRWVDMSGNASYTMTSIATLAGATSATWVFDGGGGGALATLTGDSGTATPSGGNIQIAGGSGITTSASGAVVTIALAGGSVAMDSFIPDTGTSPVLPTALGALTMAGTASQITTTGGTNTLTFSVPTTFTGPGTVNSTTTMTAGTGLTVTTGNLAVSSGNATVTGNVIASKSAAATDITVQATNSNNASATARAGVEIATGGASSGDPYLSFQISGVGASTMTMGLDNSASDLFVISNSTALGTSNALTLTQAGALTATTSITSGADITANAPGRFIGSTGMIVASGTQPTTIASDFSTGDVTIANSGGRNILLGSGDPGANVIVRSQGSTVTLATTGLTLTSTSDILVNSNLNFQTAGQKIKSTNVATTTTAGNNSFGTVTLVGGTATVNTTAVTASSIIFLTRMSVGATGANDLGVLSVGTISATNSFDINAWTVTNATALQADDVSSIGWMIVN